MVKNRAVLFCVLGILGIAAALWWRWRQDEPRRACVAVLLQLDAALNSPDVTALPNIVALPAALQGRTLPEQSQFLRKALRDEISIEGLAVLKKEGVFGPLTNIFPAEAIEWAQQAGVAPEDCVAFKLERNGLRAEAVIDINSKPFRIVRCNNVK